MTKNVPFVSVVVVNFNGLNLLQGCLASLSHQTYPREKYEIIIADNGSSDESVNYIKNNYPKVLLIQNLTNEGFASPNNKAALLAKGEFLAMLNNDMHVKEDWIAALVASQQRTGAECVGGAILNGDGSEIDFFGGLIDCFGFTYSPYHRKTSSLLNEIKQEEDVFYVSGGALLINKEVYLSIGGLDEDMYLYHEDDDLCWRLWLLGYRVVASPFAISFHCHSSTSGRFARYQICFYDQRNPLIMLYKNYDIKNVYKFTFAFVILRILRLIDRLRAEGVMSTDNTLNFLTPKDKLQRSIIKMKIYVRLIKRFDELLIMLMAVFGFLNILPSMKDKRKAVQIARKRTDEEIMQMFYVEKNYFRSGYERFNIFLKEWISE